jgi:2-polyprenyl-3-methyl-5-hydroxy-6-metoxy-1,4-benzoquinol methylase
MKKIDSKELFYDRISDVWGSKINNSETNKRIKVIFDIFLHKNELKNKKFLEVGCGLGYFSNKASKLGAKVTGIDIGPNLVKINKKLTPSGTFIVSSASNLPFKDETFDVVLSTEVIEHVDNQKRAIKEISRVLKKGGILVITTPNKIFKPLFDFLSFINIRPYHGNEKWIYSWDLRRYFEDSGLTLQKEKYFNFIAPNKFFDIFEGLGLLKHLTINYGFKFIK